MTNAASILVTGASGFIGRALVCRLSSEGAGVIGAVRRLTGEKCELLSPSLGEGVDWRPLVSGRTVVVHTAGRAHVLNDRADCPTALFRVVNTVGTLRLAEQSAESGVGRFVFLSSIGVNGNHNTRAFTETTPPNPKEPYALSKLEAEEGLVQVGKRTGMEIVVLRPPLVYGPGAPGNFGRLASAVKRGIPLPLGSVTDNRRTLVGLDNLVDLIVTCAYHPAAANQVFLAGDDEDLSTADLLRRMAKAFGVSPRLLPVPVPLLRAMARAAGKGGMVERLCGSLQVDITKAREVLGWKPPLTVDEGLARVAEGF